MGTTTTRMRSGQQNPSGAVSVPVTMHWLWSPFGLLVLLPLPALIGSLAIPEPQYLILFQQPMFLTQDLRGLALGYLLIIAIIFAVAVPMKASSTVSIRLDFQACRWLDASVKTLAVVTFSAYAIWLGVAVARGLGPQSVIALITGEAGSMYTLRNNYFETLGGVTTWMQLGAILAPLAILRSRASGKSARGLLIGLFTFALARALLNSERLALIEIALSTLLAVLILRPEAPRLLRSPIVTAGLIVGGWAGLLLVFAGFEFFRSWASVQATYTGGFWSYVTNLLLGYYATALNLAAFDAQMLQGQLQLSSLFDGNVYEQLFGASAIGGAQKAYGLETFTNRSGLLVPNLALGAVGGAILLIAVAAFIATLARRAGQGRVVAFAMYCGSAVGVLEIVRIFYFGSSRFLPLVVAGCLLAITWSLTRAGSRGKPLRDT